MIKRNKSLKKVFIVVILLLLTYAYISICRNLEAEALSKYGSRGQEVITIQTKLKRWGYYKGAIDGVYGAKTVEAVKAFQRKNGLKVDGIAGEQTLKAMGIYPSNTNTNSSSTSDMNLLSRLVYAEARGEPYTGQVAVASVVLNRVRSSAFPNTVARRYISIGCF